MKAELSAAAQASRKLRDGIAPYLFSRAAKQDREEGEDPVVLPQACPSFPTMLIAKNFPGSGSYF